MTLTDQMRLADICAHLENHRAMGMDVSSREAEFFLKVIEQMRQGERK